MPPKQAPVDPTPVAVAEPEIVIEVCDSKWMTVKEDEYSDICVCDESEVLSKFQGFMKIDMASADNMRAQILEEYLLHTIMYLLFSMMR